MKKMTILGLVSMLTFGVTSIAYAHPGRTDKNGGHTCKTNCSKWGLKNGQYHYHKR